MKDVEQLVKSSMTVEDALRRVFLVNVDERNLKAILELSQDFDDRLKSHKFIKVAREIVKNGFNDEVRYEYNKLFIGPLRPKAVPFESTYFDHNNMFGKETLQVRAFYDRAGVGLTKEQLDKFPDDFIGYELQYLYYMSFLALDRLALGNVDEFYEILKEKSEFLSSHPSLWFDKFASCCKKEANWEIWQNFADFLLLYLKLETENLAKIVAKRA